MRTEVYDGLLQPGNIRYSDPHNILHRIMLRRPGQRDTHHALNRVDAGFGGQRHQSLIELKQTDHRPWRRRMPHQRII